MGFQMRLILAAAVLVAGFSAVASAGEPVVSGALRGSSNDWTGFHAGIELGHHWSKDNFPDESKGGVGGFFAGYSHQFGKAVIGVEAEHFDLDDRFDVIPVKFKALTNLKLRGGLAVDRVLVYGTAGFTYGDIEMFGKDWGYVVGGGVDFKVDDNIVIGGQYLHHEFKDYNGTPIDGSVDLATVRAAFVF